MIIGAYGPLGGITGSYTQAGIATQAANPSAPTIPNFSAAASGSASAAPQDASIAQQKAMARVMNDRFAQECQTCKNRKYQDGSNDSGVSFQTPQHIDPGASAAVVTGHEQEHVMRERAAAESEGGEVISQSVTLHGDICPECGRYYIAGGTTETVVRHGGHKTDTEMKDPAQGSLNTSA